MWEEIVMYLRPETVIITLVLWCLGLFLKLYPESGRNDWLIPYILLTTGVFLTPLYIIVLSDIPGSEGHF
jgi:hypothetical protein